ncbi:MAG TPA: DinB family protein [Sediminibacterium sp.]|nr:DinB family protein [Sediminibacterium sp.]
MIKEALLVLFERDLKKLKTEIAAYPSPAVLWQTVPGIANSGGNLCLHLVGNLRHFIGHVLGGTGYQRNRPAEFETTGLPAETLLKDIDDTISELHSTISGLNDAALEAVYPQKVFDADMQTGYFLLHLLGHLDYHLGQINYHRRITSASSQSLG